jgi:hypothetical protein
VRAQAGILTALAEADALPGWRLHPERLPETADLVAAVVRDNYPSLEVPYHARWRHFPPGRWEALRDSLPASEQPRAAFDLAIISVLLDAGAGMGWRWRDGDGAEFSRSEGLAMASLAMFARGDFGAPGRADGETLATITAAQLAEGFQVSTNNPLVGLEGRAALLRRLGAVLPRPGALFDLLAGQNPLPAENILIAVLRHLGPVWPGRITRDGVNLGDTWRHPSIPGDGLIPFHKLSQWLSYSLVEPLQAAGIAVTDLDALTGLPEYRNGGLFFDMGVITLRDPLDSRREHQPDSPLIVGWRALTVTLLDRLAPMVRARLGVSAEAFPLARMLEGGSWAAGRRLAAIARRDGGPPLRVVSDGTVF